MGRSPTPTSHGRCDSITTLTSTRTSTRLGNNISVIGPEPEDFNSTGDSYIEVRLTATDSHGLSTTVSRTVQPRRVTLTFDTVPAGLDLVIEGQTFTTPRRSRLARLEDRHRGSRPVRRPGVQHYWTSWSDGGRRPTRSSPRSAQGPTRPGLPLEQAWSCARVRASLPKSIRPGRGRCPGSPQPSLDDAGHRRLGDSGHRCVRDRHARGRLCLCLGDRDVRARRDEQDGSDHGVGQHNRRATTALRRVGTCLVLNPSANATLDLSSTVLASSPSSRRPSANDPSGVEQ